VASNLHDIWRNAAHIQAMLERRGIRSQLLEVPDAAPSVYGELTTPGATRTVVFYAHFDGQPVDSAKWLSPPWQPVLRSGALGPDARELSLSGDERGRFDPESRI
jgi:acetylornithine deacetylase/succinyl-diaminopimelate desuccinylase-like protein